MGALSMMLMLMGALVEPAVAQETIRTSAMLETRASVRSASALGEGQHCIVTPELRVPLIGLRDPLEAPAANTVARALVAIEIDRHGIVHQARIAGEGDPVCHEDVLRFVRSLQFRPHRGQGAARESMIVSVFTQRREAS